MPPIALLNRFPAVNHALARIQRTLPALAFFGGFIWDALTLGRNVAPLDLWILAGYLALAAVILWFLGKRQAERASLPPVPDAQEAPAQGPTPDSLSSRSPDRPKNDLAPKGCGSDGFPAPGAQPTPPWWQESGPYLLLQFCFGGLFSALFIFYFKSTSHFLALMWALGLGVLLVANEFLEDEYRRFTLTWALFGLCAMLLLNFAIPHLLGSLSAFWFYLSTLAGAGLAHGLRHKTPGRPGRIRPVWAVACALILAWLLDVIPPVPLVKRSITVGHDLTKQGGDYVIHHEKTPWWIFWREVESEIHLAPGERLFCLAAVFAPSGLNTRIYHHWRFKDPEQGWVSSARVGLGLAGGRQGGYRGYTYKSNLAPGDWEVSVETEAGRTVAVHEFTVSDTPREGNARMLEERI